MATIQELLQQLINDKTTLVNNLQAKGVNSASDLMTYTQLVPLILDIQTGGIDTSDATATPEDIKNGITAYVNGEKITGTVYTRGAVTAVVDGKQHWLKEGFYNGGITIPGDENLKASNIKKDVTIYGVTGLLDENMNLDTSDATATAEDILEGKTAYVDGAKITGTYVPSTTTEHIVLDTTGFSAIQNTLDTYGNKTYISEDEGQTFKTLQEIYDLYYADDSGNPTYKDYIMDDLNQQYGIMMDNWSAGGSLPTSILFAEPITLKSPAFIMNFYCSLSSWTNVTMHIHLYKAKSGETAEEKLANIKQQIANKESGVWNGDLTYLGAANKTPLYIENENIDFTSGEYYIYIDGFTKNNQTNITLIRIRLLNF